MCAESVLLLDRDYGVRLFVLDGSRFWCNGFFFFDGDLEPQLELRLCRSIELLVDRGVVRI